MDETLLLDIDELKLWQLTWVVVLSGSPSIWLSF
jgi:hypothetical protein